MDLIRKGYWRGPSLLLSPAAVPGIDDVNLKAPHNMPIMMYMEVMILERYQHLQSVNIFLVVRIIITQRQ